MKHLILISLLTLLAGSPDKGLRTVVVTTTPQMHCASCENKIKGNLRFEKGVKKIETSIENQTVTVTYDASKNTAEGLAESFAKFGYKAKIVQDEPATQSSKKSASGKKAPTATERTAPAPAAAGDRQR